MNVSSNYRSASAERALMAVYDRALKHWPVPCEERTVATRFGDTFVLAFGDPAAPPLVLLHGSASNSAMWAQDAPAYARRFRVYAVDLPGETGRSTPARPPWDGSAFADWLGDVFDGLGLETAMIAGISQGGWTALKFAVSAPSRVRRLVLIAPGGVIPARTSFVLQTFVYQFMGGRGARRITRMVFAPQPVPEVVEKGFMFMFRNFKARRGKLPMFSDAELRTLTMPVLLIGGDQDAILDVVGIQQRLSGLLPRFQSEIIAGAGHALVNTADRAVAFLTAGDEGP